MSFSGYSTAKLEEALRAVRQNNRILVESWKSAFNYQLSGEVETNLVKNHLSFTTLSENGQNGLITHFLEHHNSSRILKQEGGDPHNYCHRSKQTDQQKGEKTRPKQQRCRTLEKVVLVKISDVQI